MRLPQALNRLASFTVLALTACAGTSASLEPASARAVNASCAGQDGVVLQVLGSGGPIAETDGRNSTGYLLWVEGRARLLVDLGRGAVTAYGRSGADPHDLSAVLLSHLHVDHSGDIPALAKTLSFTSRESPVRVFGPGAGEGFPAVDAFMQRLLGAEGAYGYLKALESEGVTVAPEVIDSTLDRLTLLEGFGDLRVQALGVPHGPVPALAYEVTAGGVHIVFMGDQRADQPGFVEFAKDADLLVAHLAIGQEPSEVAANLHATAAQIGDVAAAAQVKRMLLSHLMKRSLEDLPESQQVIGERYDGLTQVAKDGQCIQVLPAQ